MADHLSEARFYNLVLIGVDENSCRRGQRRYLTCVADHQRGAIVWARPGRDTQTLQAFFELLSDRRQRSPHPYRSSSSARSRSATGVVPRGWANSCSDFQAGQ